MTINIIGKTSKVRRIVTGMYSFDRAFENAAGQIGFPLGASIELSGPTFCGKSTLTFGLSGLIATETQSNIALADFEGFDPEFLVAVLEQSKYSGDVKIIQEDDDEKTLDALIDIIKDKKYGVGILDSVGAISPISELEGSLGEANMGKRAKLMAQLVRRTMHVLRGSNKTLFMINHLHPNIGFAGQSTIGGVTIQYLSAVIIRMKRIKEFPDNSYVIEGRVYKNKFGIGDRKFQIVMLSGKGIHKGLTAMNDCFVLKLASDARNVVRIGDTSFGHIRKFFEEAHQGNDQPFEPFFDLLKNANTPIISDTTDTDSSEGELEDTAD